MSHFGLSGHERSCRSMRVLPDERRPDREQVQGGKQGEGGDFQLATGGDFQLATDSIDHLHSALMLGVA